MDGANNGEWFRDRVTPMILCFNEIDNIERTLTGLAWAHQILVIDSGSTDGTLDILARYPNVRVVTRTFDSFAQQANFGLAKVSTDWVLSMDSDYVVGPALVTEIGGLDPDGAIAGFRVAFDYLVFGQPLRSTIYPPRVILYRVANGRYHDIGHGHRVTINGPVRDLRAHIAHDDRKPISRWFSSQSGYVSREADYLESLLPSQRSRLQRLRLMAWPTPFIMAAYTLFWKGYVWNGRVGLYYAFQRIFAELMLVIELNDRRLRRRATPKADRTAGETGDRTSDQSA